MRKMNFLFIFAFLVVVSGCSINDIVVRNYHLKGENNHWIAEYKGYSKGYFYKQDDGKLNYKGNVDEKLTLTYKGELSELSQVRKVGYSWIGGGGTDGFDSPPDRKVFTWQSIGKGGVIAKDNVENITVILDDKSETLEMKIIK
jgi:hypothetical protein